MTAVLLVAFRLLMFALTASAFVAFGRGNPILGWVLIGTAVALLVASFVIYVIGRFHHAVDVIDKGTRR